MLEGRDPNSGTPLGVLPVDRYRSDAQVIRAVSGYDATFFARKSLSVLWAITGDARLLDAHDVAVAAALAHLERLGSTTRVRANGGRLFVDSAGLTMATFRQTTSREDDPQIHTHAVISAKVRTGDGRWRARSAAAGSAPTGAKMERLVGETGVGSTVRAVDRTVGLDP